MKYLFYLLIMNLLFTIIACDKTSSPESAKARAAAEGEAQKDVENKNLSQKSQAMEAELAAKNKFYSALEGEYEGIIKISNQSYKIKLIFARSIPAYNGNRTRQLSEIEVELNNLYFNTKIVQWHPADLSSAVGCQVTDSRPNMEMGVMTLSSSTCSNFYQIYFSENQPDDKTLSQQQVIDQAKIVSYKVKSGSLESIPFIMGQIQPANNAIKYTFYAKRIK
jgi:hypothetical protein